jgi:hypothetical protein
MQYTITLTEIEKLGLQYVAYDPQDWIENVMKERARLAIEDIVKIAVDRFIEAEQTIPGSKEEIVAAAYENNWIETAKDRTDNSEPSL